MSQESNLTLLQVAAAVLKTFAERNHKPSLEQRSISIEDSATGQRLRISSDGLTLSDKMSLEQFMTTHLHANGISGVSINFARSGQATDGQAVPAPPKKTSSAFGLSLNKLAIPKVRHIVVVASGKGGVGKSTVSANLAVALRVQGLRVGLMDCDVYGPSAPMLLGVQGELLINENSKMTPLIGHGVKVVSFGFLTDSRNPVIWRGPLVSKSIEQFCYDTEWGDLDVMIVDLPPGTGDVQLTIAERLPIHSAIIVTTPQDIALIDAHKAVTMFEKLDVPVAGVVENMAWHICEKCGHEEHLFGERAFKAFLDERSLPLIARIPLTAEIRQKSDAGEPPARDQSSLGAAPYFKIAAHVMDRLGYALKD